MFGIFNKKIRHKQISDYDIKQRSSSIEDINEFIYKWNIYNPVDRWYRKKYNLSFNSPEHRVVSFIDMMIEYKEDKVFEELVNQNTEEKYNPSNGNWLKDRIHEEGEDESGLTNEEMIEQFNQYIEQEQ